MPTQVIGLREKVVTLRMQDFRSLLCQQCLTRGVMARNMLAEDDAEVRRLNGECSKVEDLVMKRTQGQSVSLDVGPARLEPLDVRGFETNGLLAETEVVAANAAAVFVGTQHPLAKTRIAAST